MALMESGNDSQGYALAKEARITDLKMKRSLLMSQLGVSLYSETKEQQQFRKPRETLYCAIEEIDEKLSDLESQSNTEKKDISSNETGATFSCPRCERIIHTNDSFCPGCGMMLRNYWESMHICISCGSLLGFDDAYCTNCGTAVRRAVRDNAPSHSSAEDEIDRIDWIACPACGFQASVESTFCCNCGLRLG